MTEANMNVASDDEIEKFRLTTLLQMTTSAKLNKQFNEEIDKAAEKVKMFRSMFEDKNRPDISSSIKKYLQSDSTKELYKKLKQ